VYYSIKYETIDDKLDIHILLKHYCLDSETFHTSAIVSFQ